MKKRLILASTSKARVEIFNDTGIEYDLIPNTLDEEKEKLNLKENQKLSIDEAVAYVKRLSLLKGKTIINEVSNSIIISADTVVYFNGEILEKPKTKEEANIMLKKLSGNTHKVITGVTLINTDLPEPINYSCVTDIKFKELNDNVLEYMINLDDTYTHAGAYNISGELASLIEVINGDFDNAKGLPLQNILELLESTFGFIPSVKKT